MLYSETSLSEHLLIADTSFMPTLNGALIETPLTPVADLGIWEGGSDIGGHVHKF